MDKNERYEGMIEAAKFLDSFSSTEKDKPFPANLVASVNSKMAEAIRDLANKLYKG